MAVPWMVDRIWNLLAICFITFVLDILRSSSVAIATRAGFACTET